MENKNFTNETQNGTVNNVKICAACGAQCPEHYVFCSGCGAALPEPVAVEAAAPAEPVAIPAEPVAIPAEPVVIPAEPVAIPEEPIAIPEEPVAIPEEPVLAPPAEPGTLPEEPVYAPQEAPAYGMPQTPPAPQPGVPVYTYMPEQTPEQPKKKKKKFYKRKLFWVFVVILGICIIAGVAGSASSGGSSSSGSTYVPTVSPYVRMVKDATNSNYGITYGKAFDYFFSNTKWSHFTATTGETVVEFEGRFTYDNSPATAKIQFVLNISGGTFSAYHLSINGVAQNKLMLATLLKKVFETAVNYYY